MPRVRVNISGERTKNPFAFLGAAVLLLGMGWMRYTPTDYIETPGLTKQVEQYLIEKHRTPELEHALGVVKVNRERGMKSALAASKMEVNLLSVEGRSSIFPDKKGRIIVKVEYDIDDGETQELYLRVEPQLIGSWRIINESTKNSYLFNWL